MGNTGVTSDEFGEAPTLVSRYPPGSPGLRAKHAPRFLRQVGDPCGRRYVPSGIIPPNYKCFRFVTQGGALGDASAKKKDQETGDFNRKRKRSFSELHQRISPPWRVPITSRRQPPDSCAENRHQNDQDVCDRPFLPADDDSTPELTHIPFPASPSLPGTSGLSARQDAGSKRNYPSGAIRKATITEEIASVGLALPARKPENKSPAVPLIQSTWHNSTATALDVQRTFLLQAHASKPESQSIPASGAITPRAPRISKNETTAVQVNLSKPLKSAPCVVELSPSAFSPQPVSSPEGFFIDRGNATAKAPSPYYRKI
ncbi:hypothetical protein MMC21_006160 [Puttea exsequens]|nr:hypothetical protein [Puttea exsequens]